MGGHNPHGMAAWVGVGLSLCCGISFGFVGFIMFIIAGGVAFGSPFIILPTIALIIGVIGMVLTGITMGLFCCFFLKEREDFHFIAALYISRFLFAIIALISLPVSFIIAVGFFSLESSLDVSFAKPYEKVETGVDWITQTKKKMISAGVLLIIGFVFVIFPIISLLACSCYNDYPPKEKYPDVLAIVVVQLLCSLILFLPLQLFGRSGLAPVGFAGLKDSTYTGLYVLGVVHIVLTAVNIVVAGVSLISFKVDSLRKPILKMFIVLAAIGCVVSIPVFVCASIVLAERTKVKSNLQAFCTADAGVSSPSPHCNELLTRFRASMCAAGEGKMSRMEMGIRGEGEGGKGKKGEMKQRETERERGRKKKEEGQREEGKEEEGEGEGCEDQYTMEVLQERIAASTRGWMGFMGFACMILSFAQIGVSLLMTLLSFVNIKRSEKWERERAGKRVREREESQYVTVALGNQELITKDVNYSELKTLVFKETFVFNDVNVEDENNEVKFVLHAYAGHVRGTGSMRLSEYTTNPMPKQRVLIPLKKDIPGTDVGVLTVDIILEIDGPLGRNINVLLFIDNFTNS